ncbi:MAG: efflux RND transporter periplasmic adaptor subunit [Helicobacteraceae bacterium]|jgi:RND family efflux transporter MFP subunit|nr:efflux RND transporter periplasmic adaptor subunit [Helicobacteraceae bacterium]
MKKAAFLIGLFWTFLSGADDPVNVVTVAVKTGNFYPFESYVGTLKYRTLATLSAESAAVLSVIKKDTGDQVKEGEELAVQDSAILRANIEAKEAELQKALAGETQAKKDAERYKTLFEQNSVSEQTYEQFRLKAIEFQASSKALQAEIKAMKIELAKRTIRAPFGGRIVERFVSAGDYLAAGAGIVSIAKTDTIELNVFLSAETVSRIKTGDKVVVSVMGGDYEAKIAGISPKGDISSRSFLTRVTFAQPNETFLEGMEGILKLPGKSAENVLIVPRDAVISRNGSQAVFYVSDNVAYLANVEVVGFDGLDSAVKSNVLKDGMRVISKGNERIVPNQLVKPQ